MDPARPRAGRRGPRRADRRGRSDADVAPLVGPRTPGRRPRAAGPSRPGFQDAHVHPVTAGVGRLRCDLRGPRGRDAYLATIAGVRGERTRTRRGSSAAAGPWPTSRAARRAARTSTAVVAGPAGLPRRTATATALGQQPRRSSSPGIDAPTRRDPADGRIERDPDGTPTGALQEGAADARRAPAPRAHRRRTGDAAFRARPGVPPRARASRPGRTRSSSPTIGDRGLPPRPRRGRADRPGRRRRCGGSGDRGAEQVDELVERRARTRRSAGYRANSVKLMLDGVAGERSRPRWSTRTSTRAAAPTTNRGHRLHRSGGVEGPRRPARRRRASSPTSTPSAIGPFASALDAVEAARAGERHDRHATAHRPHPGHPPRRHAALRRARRGRQRPAAVGLPRPADGRPHDPVPGPGAGDVAVPVRGRCCEPARASRWAPTGRVSTPDPLVEIEVAVNRVCCDTR